MGRSVTLKGKLHSWLRAIKASSPDLILQRISVAAGRREATVFSEREECGSKKYTEWDYESKKCPQCKDGIIDESDEGVLIMAD